ncbi:hypothetical protein AcV7_010357 [Taiwanofungus camphoratus]|nr:hypothetical protein AcV7_010357 [Antrodia cinnamomea]
MVPASQAEPVVEFKGIVRALTGNQLLHPIPVQHVAPPYQPFHAPPFPKPIHKPQRESMKHRHYTIGDKITLVLMLLLGLSWELSLAVARAIIPISVIPADKLGRTIRPSDRRQAHTTIPQKAEKDATASSESPEHINFSIYSWLGSLLKAAGLVQVLRYLWTETEIQDHLPALSVKEISITLATLFVIWLLAAGEAEKRKQEEIEAKIEEWGQHRQEEKEYREHYLRELRKAWSAHVNAGQ